MKYLNKPLFVLSLLSCFCATRSPAILVNVTTSIAGTNYSYTLYNNEASNSAYQLNGFHLTIDAPFNVVSTPTGWTFDTDNLTYVDWYSTSTNYPFSNGLAPGEHLSGFAIASSITNTSALQFAVSSWSQAATNSGPTYLASVLVPDIASVAATLTLQRIGSDTNVVIGVDGVPTASYFLQFSPTLINWSNVITNAAPFTYSTSESVGLSSGFYRAGFVTGSFSVTDD